MSALIVQAMHGLGDCIHQRAVIRQLMQRHTVYLHTVWPNIYRDLAADGLILLPQETKLRTQAKNAKRLAREYSTHLPPPGSPVHKAVYHVDEIRRSTLMSAMLRQAACDPAKADFRMPVSAESDRKLTKLLRPLNKGNRPILVYRPLVQRGEWVGSSTRNPDRAAYHALFSEIASEFFVVSIADLEAGKEHIVSQPIAADVEWHAGELDVDMIAALMARASLVFTSPGFSLVMALSVGTPVISVFGGFECAQRWIDSALYGPFLGINPRKPCNCLLAECGRACAKDINIAAAVPQVRRFAAMALRKRPDGPRPEVEIPVKTGPMPDRFMGPGEIETITKLIGGVSPRVVIEFGVNAGRTAKALLNAIPTIQKYVGIDVPPGFVTALPAQRKEVEQDPGHLVASDKRFELLLLPHGSRDLAPGDLPACDAVFIDGDHSKVGVLHDTQLAKAALRPGGIIVWHDDHDQQGDVQVRAALDEMHAFGEATATHVAGTWIAFERKGDR